MYDLIRDAPFGQALNWISKGRLLPYNDRVLHSPGAAGHGRHGNTTKERLERTATGSLTLVEEGGFVQRASDSEDDPNAGRGRRSPGKGDASSVDEKHSDYPYLVGWYDEQDQDNPRNWTRRKRVFVAGVVSFMTFSVYTGSAIYVAALPSIMEEFGVSEVVGLLGLSLFVLAYGMGPMILAPVQEVPGVGRTPVYWAGLAIFVLFQLPILLAKNMGTILVFRFLSAFSGSACLATGGSSLADLFGPEAFPAAIGAWQLAAIAGPVAGPLMGGFAAQALGWRWPIIELTILSGLALVVITFLLPETLESTILIRRAQRIRRMTGNDAYKTALELEGESEGRTNSVLTIAKQRMVHAFQLCLEPFVLYANIYSGVTYAVFYLFFESFPLVFEEMHGFSLGVLGLAYIGFLVTGITAYFGYVIYQRQHLLPRLRNDPDFRHEHRLELGLAAGCLIPLSLFIFGWTSRPDVHWIWPIIGASLYCPGIYLLSQAIVLYTLAAYPKYSASILAGQTLFRSSMASAFPLFGRFFYEALGLGGGCSLLAGVSIVLVFVLFILYRWGHKLRARSRWAS